MNASSCGQYTGRYQVVEPEVVEQLQQLMIAPIWRLSLLYPSVSANHGCEQQS